MRNFACLAGAVAAIGLATACNRQPEGTSDTFDQSKTTTTSSIESGGTTGATDYNNDSTLQGSSGSISSDTSIRTNGSTDSPGSHHNR